jgi:Receptor family ligand binding region
LNWSYVSLVNSPDTYGDGGALDIQVLLQEKSTYGICLATVVRIPPAAVDADYNKVVDQLAAKIQARVVLMYVSRAYLPGFFQSVRRRVGYGWFVFVGGDTLSANENKEFADMLEGSFYTNLPSAPVPGFQQYIWSLTYGQVRLNIGALLFFNE